jgi:hypothetical protein
MNKVTVYRWIQKFIPKISEYVNSLSPQLSEVWHGNELFVKMKRGVDHTTSDKRTFEHIAFLWNVMDRKTRFLLVSKLSAFRDKFGAFQAFKEARQNSHGQYPEKIFVDSAKAYANIGNGTIVKGWNPEVIAKAGITKPHANNNRRGLCRHVKASYSVDSIVWPADLLFLLIDEILAVNRLRLL